MEGNRGTCTLGGWGLPYQPRNTKRCLEVKKLKGLRGFQRSLAFSMRGEGSFAIESAQDEDLWGVADVHCSSFYANAGVLMKPLIKLDRMISLMEGKEYEKSKRGRFECLIATAGERSFVADPPLHLSLVRHLFPKDVARGLGTSHKTRGILGALVLDDTGEHLPGIYDNAEGDHIWTKERGCAYLSNLSVSTDFRGQGVGESIVNQAELTARKWGCWGCALHCNPKNTPAFNLYTKQGYVRPEISSGNFRSLSQGHVRQGVDVLLVKLIQ